MQSTSEPTSCLPTSCTALPEEVRASLWLLLSVLVVLTCAKAAAPIPYVGAAALTFAAFWQLRAPLWRAERQGLGLDALGCTLAAWRLDAKLALCLACIILPAYAASYHWLVTRGVYMGQALGLGDASLALRAHPIWHTPSSSQGWAWAFLWFGERALTHTFGVALPEELFYRGYLQPVWQARFVARHSIFGARIGLATVMACLAFALGHFLGEWHIARLGPFFPSLLFAWQRARSGTIVGAVGLHALCNVFVEVWVRQYAPGHLGP